MSIKIPIETSARHIHVSQEDFQLLFGEDAQLHYIKELSQPGQYTTEKRRQEDAYKKENTDWLAANAKKEGVVI